ncbi:STRUBBELIG-receptor family 7-like protein [Tanacetum coccineum]
MATNKEQERKNITKQLAICPGTTNVLAEAYQRASQPLLQLEQIHPEITSFYTHSGTHTMAGVVDCIAPSDVSNNNLGNQIPYSLPPNLTSLNLAGCGYTGNLPYSISQMTSLKCLNVANNQSSGALPDMGISSNSFTGDLPQSFASLSSVTDIKDGNSWNSGTAPPSPLGTPAAAVGGGSQNRQPRGNNPSSTGGSSDSGKNLVSVVELYQEL